jgi:hypothetical protein
VSGACAAMKARRKMRQVGRNDRWLPAEVHADVEGVARIADEIVPRGWEFDHEFSSENFITWFYPPSGVEVDDESVEPVTRIWLSDPSEPHVILVGSGEDGGVDYRFGVEELFAGLDEIEAYRLGDPLPEAT